MTGEYCIQEGDKGKEKRILAKLLSEDVERYPISDARIMFGSENERDEFKALLEKADKMREILFRAKRVVDNEWVEGYFDNNYLVPIISTRWDNDEIYRETLCEFIGLYDRNGVRVFEGDIVKHYDNSFEGFDIGRVFWSQKLCEYRRTSRLPDAQFRPVDYSMGAHCEYEVIGNIYDNPELLEQEVENNGEIH